MREPRFRAAIFDLDGVLWDGEPLYQEAFNLALSPYGHRLSDDDYNQIIGHSVEASWEWVRQRFPISASQERLLAAYDEAVLGLLRGPMEPLPGVRPLLQTLREKAVPTAVASASRRAWVKATLGGLGLQRAFTAVVAAEDVDNGKPAPDLFLAAAQRLAVPSRRCLALEDTPAGIAAAKAAGMFAVQVRAASTAFPPLPEADLVVESLLDLDLSLLLGDGAQ